MSIERQRIAGCGWTLKLIALERSERNSSTSMLLLLPPSPAHPDPPPYPTPTAVIQWSVRSTAFSDSARRLPSVQVAKCGVNRAVTSVLSTSSMKVPVFSSINFFSSFFSFWLGNGPSEVPSAVGVGASASGDELTQTHETPHVQ